MNRAPWLVFAAIVFCVGALVFGSYLRAEPAPAWTLKDLDGKTVSLSDFKGKVVVLDFWATWCPSCIEEIPNFLDLKKKYRKDGVVLVGLSCDSLQPADVAKFVKAHGMDYTIVMAEQKTAMDYGLTDGIPYTLVLDRQGNIVGRHLGPTDEDVFARDIETALKR